MQQIGVIWREISVSGGKEAQIALKWLICGLHGIVVWSSCGHGWRDMIA